MLSGLGITSSWAVMVMMVMKLKLRSAMLDIGGGGTSGVLVVNG